MSGGWGHIGIYKDRVIHWQKAADALPPGAERDACLALSDGYAKLVTMVQKLETGSALADSDQ